jgi:hypothetical protein
VLIPRFNTTSSDLDNVCLEDTYKIIEFEVTDVDDPSSSLSGDIVLFFFGAAGDYYNCLEPPQDANSIGGCQLGDPLVVGDFVPISYDDDRASFRFIYIPKPNVNGVAKLLLQALDPQYAASNKEIVEITVLPVNDPPFFFYTNHTVGTAANSTRMTWEIFSTVGDVDFVYGRDLNVTYCVVAVHMTGDNSTYEVDENPELEITDAWFVLPPPTPGGELPPCEVSDDGVCISCEDSVYNLNLWLRTGIELVFNESASGQIAVELNVNDLGNVDYRDPPPPLNVSVFLLDEILAGLAATTKPAADNLILIIAPIAGLLAGAIIACLIFMFRKRAREAVESYFDRYAMGMEGATNTSPLYEGATKGGASPIYKPQT